MTIIANIHHPTLPVRSILLPEAWYVYYELEEPPEAFDLNFDEPLPPGSYLVARKLRYIRRQAEPGLSEYDYDLDQSY